MQLPQWKLMSLEQRERLRPEESFFPYPAIFAFGLVLILTAHLLPGLNPRLGNRIDLLSFSAPRQNEGSLWLGVYAEKEKLIVVTPDRSRFSWEQGTKDAGFTDFITYLRAYANQQAQASSLRGEVDATKAKAIIAIDRSLTYAELNPILLALAQARITRYGFETLTTK